MSASGKWHYRSGDEPMGPVSEEAILSLLRRGVLKPNTLVWREGMPDWAPLARSGLPGFGAPPTAGAAPPPARDLGQDAAMRMMLPVGRSGWAIVAGYLGLFSLLGFPAPFALVTGIVAIIDIRRHPEKHGLGRAWFAVILGGLMTVLLVWVLVMIALGQ